MSPPALQHMPQQPPESWCRQPAKARLPQGELWEGQEAAVSPPALQHMPQQPRESGCRQPAKSREPQGELWEGQEAAVSPPALHHMPQQPRAVVALGVPVLQEPAVGSPNNVFYTGHAVGISAK